MHSAKHTRRAAAGFLLSVTLLVQGTGCNVSDYELKMEESQRRMNYFDEQNRYLGQASILLPKDNFPKDTDEANYKAFPALSFFEFFFRPPKGIATTHPSSERVADYLFSYPAANPECSFDRVLVGAIKTKSKDSRAAFHDKIGTEIIGPNFAELQGKTRQLGQQIGHPIQFTWYSATEPDTRYLFFYEDPVDTSKLQTPDFLVAIVFFPRPAALSGSTPVDKLIDFSLTSLYVGPDAAGPINRARLASSPSGEAGK